MSSNDLESYGCVHAPFQQESFYICTQIRVTKRH